MKRKPFCQPLVLAFCLLPAVNLLSAREAFHLDQIVQDSAQAAIRYEIWVELDDINKMLRGQQELTWFNTSPEPVSEMFFHLYWNAFKNEESIFFKELKSERAERGRLPRAGEWGWIDVIEIRTGDGTDLTATREYVLPDGPEDSKDQTVMKVKLPNPVFPGECIRLSLKFISKIPRTVARSGYYRDSYFIAQWFPKPGVYESGKGWNCHAYHLNSEFYADFADFIVHINLPKKYVVGATGKELAVSDGDKPGTATHTFVQSMVHDFAWTADSRYVRLEQIFDPDKEVTQAEYEEMAVKLGLSIEEIKLPAVRMILLIMPEHRKQAERHFKALRSAIKYYGLWYGQYPYETVTMVDPPFRTRSGGMEYPTLFTAGTQLIVSKEIFNPEGVIVHEFGHGYWYGIVANNEFEEAWLDEGINTYSTGKVMTMAYGPGRIPGTVLGWPVSRLLSLPRIFDFELNRAVAINFVKLDPITTASWKFLNSMSYSANVYMRAAILLDTLEQYLGETTMARVMRTYFNRYKFKHPRTEDFISTVNEVSGRDLTWFFRELMMSTNDFDYGIDSVSTIKKPEKALGIFEVNGQKEEIKAENSSQPQKKQKLAKEKAKEDQISYVSTVVLRRYGEARLDGDASVELLVRFEDGTEETCYWDGQSRWMEFVFTGPTKIKDAHIDPKSIWLIDCNFTNNSFRVKKDFSRNMLRLASRVVFILQNILFLTSSWS